MALGHIRMDLFVAKWPHVLVTGKLGDITSMCGTTTLIGKLSDLYY
jgi:hypothetical protein